MIKFKKNDIGFYLDEVERISHLKSKRKRYKEMVDLSNKYLNDEETKANLSDGYWQYMNELFLSYLEMYKPTSFKKKLINFVSNMNMFGR